MRVLACTNCNCEKNAKIQSTSRQFPQTDRFALLKLDESAGNLGQPEFAELDRLKLILGKQMFETCTHLLHEVKLKSLKNEEKRPFFIRSKSPQKLVVSVN